MMATTAKATETQNSGQIWRTTAIPPTTNAISAMVEPVQAASVRPWWTCLPRLFVGCVKSERCAVPAMVPSFPLIGDMHSEHLLPELALLLALRRGAPPFGVIHCVASVAIVHIGVRHLSSVSGWID